MARIFYYSATGIIYGVHHSPHEDNPLMQLPAGVAWIDTPEPPDQIVWPSPGEDRLGREQWTRVNPRTKALELRKDITIPSADETDVKEPTAIVKFERLIDLWREYSGKHAPSWSADDPHHGLAAEVRERLAQLDIVLVYVTRTIQIVRQVPSREETDAFVHAWKELRLFTETFYFVAWRIVEILTRPGALAFPGFAKLKSRGVRNVRNHLIEHPEKHGGTYQQHVMITDAGPVLKATALVVRMATGRTEPDGSSLDRGLFVNAKELHDELLECLAPYS